MAIRCQLWIWPSSEVNIDTLARTTFTTRLESVQNIHFWAGPFFDTTTPHSRPIGNNDSGQIQLMTNGESKMTDNSRMQCMEVWGGNTQADDSFSLAGLQLYLHSLPYKESLTGGDVFYLSSCASGRITRILLADVSGHGEAVSSVAVNLRNLMRKNINTVRQSRLVRAMNQQFTEASEDDETICGGGFATAVICTFFSPTRSLQFTNAGHPIPLVFRSSSQHWEEMIANRENETGIVDTPLGIVDEAEYPASSVTLGVGDMVLIVSDAYTESLDGDGRQLGTAGFQRVVEQLDVTKPEGFLTELRDRIHQLHKDNLSGDDATAMLFQADGSQPSLRDNLMAPYRLIRGSREAKKAR